MFEQFGGAEHGFSGEVSGEGAGQAFGDGGVCERFGEDGEEGGAGAAQTGDGVESGFIGDEVAGTGVCEEVSQPLFLRVVDGVVEDDDGAGADECGRIGHDADAA